MRFLSALGPCMLTVLAADLAAQSPARIADVRQCPLASGARIANCRIGYRTFGQQNAQGTNVILIPTWLSGKSSDWLGLLGPGKIVVTLILRREGAKERDAAIRVPMRMEALAALVEDFTIRMVAADAPARIEMSWERTRWVVTLDDPQKSRRPASTNGPPLES